MNKTDKVLKALRKHKRLSAEQLREEVGFTNVYKYIPLLREKGHIIYTVQSTRTDIQYELQEKE